MLKLYQKILPSAEFLSSKSSKGNFIMRILYPYFWTKSACSFFSLIIYLFYRKEKSCLFLNITTNLERKLKWISYLPTNSVCIIHSFKILYLFLKTKYTYFFWIAEKLNWTFSEIHKLRWIIKPKIIARCLLNHNKV